MRKFFILLCALALPAFAAEAVDYAVVKPGATLTFPRDHGAHPAFRTEWWYATGHLKTASGKALGFQLTFFRNRSGVGESSTSQFTPSQILFAHAAIADPAFGRLRHDERVARAGFGVGASSEILDVALEGWSLRMQNETMQAHILAREFTLELDFQSNRPPPAAGRPWLQPQGSGITTGQLLPEPAAVAGVWQRRC